MWGFANAAFVSDPHAYGFGNCGWQHSNADGIPHYHTAGQPSHTHLGIHLHADRYAYCKRCVLAHESAGGSRDGEPAAGVLLDRGDTTADGDQ